MQGVHLGGWVWKKYCIKPELPIRGLSGNIMQVARKMMLELRWDFRFRNVHTGDISYRWH